MINSIPASQDATIATPEVTMALDGILTTDKFLASPQMSAFLRYVVEQTLIGNTRRIKAFTVGIEALGKPASFDPQTDPSVRVLAKRLRSSLDTYYLQNPDTKVFIEMKPGSYVPKFLLRSEMPVVMQPTMVPAQHQSVHAHIPQGSIAQEATSQPAMNNNTVAEQQNTAHLSVNQQPNTHAEQPNTESANSDTHGEQEDRNASINQLWNAYKSSSKVA
jgi:hypothetical protein